MSIKKIFAFVTLVLAVLCFNSCGAEKKNGWYIDFNAAQKYAQKKNKNILLFVNSFNDVEGSQDGVNLLLDTKDFTKALSKDFVCVHFDFSDISIMQTPMTGNLTNKEQKAIEKIQDMYRKQFRVADMYQIRQTPVVILMTKDGYFISDVYFDFISSSVDGYVSIIKSEKNAVDEANNFISQIKSAPKKDKVKLIDSFFENTPEAYRICLQPLVKQVLNIDKKNESGLLSKYIIANTHNTAHSFFIKGEYDEAVNVYTKAAENKVLSNTERQILYYTAGQILLAFAVETDRAKEMIEKAVAADPESEYADEFKNILQALESSIEQNMQDNNSAEDTN